MPNLTTQTENQNDDVLVLIEDREETPLEEFNGDPWKILVVDDENDVHRITEIVLRGLSFEQRGFAYLNAYSESDARRLIREHSDIALILLDVIMETDAAGLNVVRFVREELRNRFVRIILRTGFPGQAPEKKVILEYDINDYKLKSTLTDQGLFTAVISALRTYRDLAYIEEQRKALQHAMAEVEVAHKTRFQFLANMGHELRTPLGIIVGYAALFTHTHLTAQQQKYLTAIKNAGDGLTSVLINILELTEIVEGNLVIENAPFSLQKLVAEVMDIMTIHAQWKNLSISAHLSREIPEQLVGDAKYLKQALMNVLANALRYTPHGEIALKVFPDNHRPQHLVFAVSDTGIGIAQDRLQQIFQPFVLGEDVITKRFSGAGLGLAISKDIIEKMNGTIWVESEIEHGSTFYFSIPLKTPS